MIILTLFIFILQIRETLNSQPQLFTTQSASDDELNISSPEETNNDSYASTNNSERSRGRRGRGSRGPRTTARSRGGRAKGQTKLNF